MYADLELGLNLVEDPSFENGVDKWRSTGPYLLGTLSGPFWAMNGQESVSAPVTYPLSGKRMLRVYNVAPTTAGTGGIAYDFDIPLPQGNYVVSTYIRPFNNGSNQDITVRAGRSDLAAPAIIGNVLTQHPVHDKDQLWNNVAGVFSSDGVHPTSILIRNEISGSWGGFLVDSVAVIPETSLFQTDLYEQMGPVADQDAAASFALKRYLRAYALMFDQVENYVRVAPDGTPGWARIVNPRSAPAEVLDWLSQLGGTVLPFGSTTPEKRQLIEDAPGRERGTRNAIIKNVQKLLSGTKYVAIQEGVYNFNPFDHDHFAVGTLKSETPASDWFVNLVTNANFESATSPWLSSGGTLTGTSAISRDGQSSLHDTFALKVDATVVGNGTRYNLGVLPAGVYGWIIGIRGTTGSEIINISVGPSAASLPISTVWTQFSGTFTANGVTNYDITLKTAAPTPAAATFYVDGVGVALSGMSPPNFVDFGATTTLVKDAVEEQRPVEMIQNNPMFLDEVWTYWAIGSTVIATKVGDEIVFLPVYPTFQDIKRHFTSYADLKANTPHTFENLFADTYDTSLEKNIGGWLTSGANITSGGQTLGLTTGVPYKNVSAGQLVTTGGGTNQGMTINCSAWTAGKPGTYSVNIFLRAITTSAAIEVWAGNTSSPTLIFSGTIPTGSWTQVQGQFVSDGIVPDQFMVKVPTAIARTINFDLYALASDVVVFPSTF